MHKPREGAAARVRLFPSHLPAHVKHLHKKHPQTCLTQTSTATQYTTQQQNKARKKTKITHPTSIPPQSCSLTIRMRSKQRTNNFNRRLVCTSPVKRKPSDFVFFLRTCPRTSNTSTKSMRKRVSHKYQQQAPPYTTQETKQEAQTTHHPSHIHPAAVMQPHHQDAQQAAH